MDVKHLTASLVLYFTIIVAVQAVHECPSGYWDNFESASCYRVTDEKFSWDDAREECGREGGDLISIYDKDINDDLMLNLGESEDVLWIGLNDLSKEGEYHWLDEPLEADWLNFVDNYVDTDSQDCIALEGWTGLWRDQDCDDELYAICGRPYTFICPSGYMRSASSENCYKVTTNTFEWKEARDECQRDGGDLIKIYSEDQNDEIIADVDYSDAKRVLWIGLNDFQEESVYCWLDETTEPEWTYLASDFNDDAAEDCIGLEDWTSLWRDWICTSQYRGLCERPYISCPDGWVFSGSSGTCYKLHTDLKGWSNARATCQEMMGDLIKIESKSKDKEIQAYLEDNNAVDMTWIGLNDLNQEGVFFWLDEKTELQYTNWGDLQPDASSGYDCVEIGVLPDNMWETKDCLYVAQYICERHTIVCPKGWTVGATEMGTCLRHHTDEVTWSEARENCRNDGAELVVIPNKVTNSIVGEMIAYNGQGRTWVGAKDRDEDGTFYWLEEAEPISYTNWYAGQPDGHGISGGSSNIYCVEMGGMGDDFRWSDDDCNEQGKYICERSPVTCPVNWFASQMTETCVMYREDPLSWQEARKACQLERADLVKIVDETMNAFVAGLITSTGSQRTWIGLHDRNEDGVFYWLNETDTPDYTEWASGNPNNVINGEGTGQDCVEIGYVEYGKWSDDYCDYFASFLCEKPAIKCLEGWTASMMSDSCVKYYDEITTWSEARSTCQGDGGDLVKIPDEKMNNFVDGMVKSNGGGSIWIGLHEDGGQFVWLDSSNEPDYWNWAFEDTKDEDCVQLGAVDYGQWTTASCSSTSAFMCEKLSESALEFATEAGDTPHDDDGPEEDEPKEDEPREDETREDDDDDDDDDDDKSDDDDATSSDSFDDTSDPLASGSSDTGMSGGAVAGVVICVLVLTSAALLVSWRYRAELSRAIRRRGLSDQRFHFANDSVNEI